MENFIVAEVTKNWTSTTPVSDLISQKFAMVINVNKGKGYKLLDWKFYTSVADHCLSETIIAIFQKEQPEVNSEKLEYKKVYKEYQELVENEGLKAMYAIRRGEVYFFNVPTWQEFKRSKYPPQMNAARPPLGLMPIRFHEQGRLNDIYSAIERYKAVQKEIPKEWILELETLEETLKSYEKSQSPN